MHPFACTSLARKPSRMAEACASTPSVEDKFNVNAMTSLGVLKTGSTQPASPQRPRGPEEGSNRSFLDKLFCDKAPRFDVKYYNRRKLTVRIDQLLPLPLHVRDTNAEHLDTLVESFEKYGYDTSYGLIRVVRLHSILGNVFRKWRKTTVPVSKERDQSLSGHSDLALPHQRAGILQAFFVVDGRHRHGALLKRIMKRLSNNLDITFVGFAELTVEEWYREDGRDLSSIEILALASHMNQITERMRPVSFLDNLTLSCTFLRELITTHRFRDCGIKITTLARVMRASELLELHAAAKSSAKHVIYARYARVARFFVRNPVAFQSLREVDREGILGLCHFQSTVFLNIRDQLTVTLVLRAIYEYVRRPNISGLPKKGRFEPPRDNQFVTFVLRLVRVVHGGCQRFYKSTSVHQSHMEAFLAQKIERDEHDSVYTVRDRFLDFAATFRDFLDPSYTEIILKRLEDGLMSRIHSYLDALQTDRKMSFSSPAALCAIRAVRSSKKPPQYTPPGLPPFRKYTKRTKPYRRRNSVADERFYSESEDEYPDVVDKPLQSPRQTQRRTMKLKLPDQGVLRRSASLRGCRKRSRVDDTRKQPQEALVYKPAEEPSCAKTKTECRTEQQRPPKKRRYTDTGSPVCQSKSPKTQNPSACSQQQIHRSVSKNTTSYMGTRGTKDTVGHGSPPSRGMRRYLKTTSAKTSAESACPLHTVFQKRFAAIPPSLLPVLENQSSRPSQSVSPHTLPFQQLTDIHRSIFWHGALLFVRGYLRLDHDIVSLFARSATDSIQAIPLQATTKPLNHHTMRQGSKPTMQELQFSKRCDFYGVAYYSQRSQELQDTGVCVIDGVLDDRRIGTLSRDGTPPFQNLLLSIRDGASVPKDASEHPPHLHRNPTDHPFSNSRAPLDNGHSYQSLLDHMTLLRFSDMRFKVHGKILETETDTDYPSVPLELRAIKAEIELRAAQIASAMRLHHMDSPFLGRTIIHQELSLGLMSTEASARATIPALTTQDPTGSSYPTQTTGTGRRKLHKVNTLFSFFLTGHEGLRFRVFKYSHRMVEGSTQFNLCHSNAINPSLLDLPPFSVLIVRGGTLIDEITPLPPNSAEISTVKHFHLHAQIHMLESM